MTKDDVRNRHLEERVGMFLAKNLRHQHYTVEVTGVAQPTHMELDCELASDYEDEQNFNNGPLTILDSKNATLVDEDDYLRVEVAMEMATVRERAKKSKSLKNRTSQSP